MKDLFGVELKVGQLVGYTTSGTYRYMMRAKVVGFTPKKVKIELLHNLGVWSVGHITNVEPISLTVSILSEEKNV